MKRNLFILILLALLLLLLSCTERKPFADINVDNQIDLINGQVFNNSIDSYFKLKHKDYFAGVEKVLPVGNINTIESRILFRFNLFSALKNKGIVLDSIMVNSVQFALHINEKSPKNILGNIAIYKMKPNYEWFASGISWYRPNFYSDSLTWDGGDFEPMPLSVFPANKFSEIDSSANGYTYIETIPLKEYFIQAMQDSSVNYSSGLIMIGSGMDSLLYLDSGESEYKPYLNVIYTKNSTIDTLKVYPVTDGFIMRDYLMENSYEAEQDMYKPNNLYRFNSNKLKISSGYPLAAVFKFDLPDSIENFVPDSLVDKVKKANIKLKDIIINKAYLNIYVADYFVNDNKTTLMVSALYNDWAADDSVNIASYYSASTQTDSLYQDKKIKLDAKIAFQKIVTDKNNGLVLKFSDFLNYYQYINFYSSESQINQPYIELTYSLPTIGLYNLKKNFIIKKIDCITKGY